MLFNDYTSVLTNLRVDRKMGGAPHKPLLILTIMDCIESGLIDSERIFLTNELIYIFKRNWYRWTDRKTPSILLPFYHMRSEGFWTLVTKPGEEIILTNSGSPSSLTNMRHALDYALMNQDLFFALCDPAERMRLRIQVIQKYFPYALSKDKPYDAYMEDVQSDILTMTGSQYRDKVKDLEKKKDPKVYQVERVARNKQFENVIKEKYNYSCSISHLCVRLENKTSLVDACHIVPFSQSYDDTIGNGIALSPTLHRAFDKGLITISEKYKVVVSNWFEENESSLYGLRRLNNLELRLPENKAHHPSLDNLLWHRQTVFRG